MLYVVKFKNITSCKPGIEEAGEGKVKNEESCKNQG